MSNTYVYDSQNKLVSSTDPTGNSEYYTYYNNSNVKVMTDKNVTRTTNVYNRINSPHARMVYLFTR